MLRFVLPGVLVLGCTGPVEPAKGVAPVEPVKAVEPVQAVQPVQPVKAGEPVQPGEPAKGVEPVVQPVGAVGPLAGHRDIHPIGDGAPGCVEMYSACSPDPKGGQRCTSARYDLDCGETGQAPGGDKIRCVCP